MNTIRNITILWLFLAAVPLTAQQEGVITNFRYHMNAFNPAYVGLRGETLISTSFRQQWSGIEDAPAAQIVSFGSPIARNLGIGVSVYNSNTFVESQTFTGIDFSYKLQLTARGNLYFGLKAGGNFYSVNTSGLETYNMTADPGISSISRFNPNIGAGLLFEQGRWHVSLAIPRLLTTERADQENGLLTPSVAKPHLYSSGGYEFILNPVSNLMLQPTVLLRYVNGAPLSADLNTMLSFNGDFSIGASYRTDAAFAGLVNFRLKKRWLIGYAYEVSSREELASVGNTNEFLLQFLF